MRVLMLTWYYPPQVIGGIAAHVDGLTRAMARLGHDVVVLAPSRRKRVDHEIAGVRVERVPVGLPWLPDDDLVAQAASASHHFVQQLHRLGEWKPDVVHVHDWRLAWAADTIATITRRVTRHHHPRHRAGAARRPPPSRDARHGALRGVVARLPIAGAHRLFQVHGARSGHRLGGDGRPSAPDPQRHRPGEVGAAGAIGAARPACAHVGAGAVREGLPSAVPCHQRAPWARRRDRVRHRRPRQLPPGAAVADRPRGCQRPRRPPRLPQRRPAPRPPPSRRMRRDPVAVRAVRDRRPGGTGRRGAAHRRSHGRASPSSSSRPAPG